MSKPKESDFSSYLSSWRDVSLLRVFECFLESAPQVVLQLYVLSTLGRKITVAQDWVIISAVSLSICSIGWSMVSYSHALRLCNKRKGFSVCGYTFQVVYRLSMISSRIAALTLFTIEYGWIVVVITFFHFLLMVAWLRYEGSDFCSHPNRWLSLSLESLFTVVMGFVYVFCFINVKEGTTRNRVMIYYLIFFIENSLLVAMWYPTRTHMGTMEIGAIIFTWGGFLIGIGSMLAYYKFFHPRQDITEGWCTCCSNKNNAQSSPLDTSLELKSEYAHGIDVVHPVSPPSLTMTPRVKEALSVGVDCTAKNTEATTRRKFPTRCGLRCYQQITSTSL